jgi:hypothetical protein
MSETDRRTQLAHTLAEIDQKAAETNRLLRATNDAKLRRRLKRVQAQLRRSRFEAEKMQGKNH